MLDQVLILNLIDMKIRIVRLLLWWTIARTTSSSSIISQSRNLSILPAPSDFDIEYSLTRDYGPPLDEIGIYMTAMTALEDLCFRAQSAPLPDYPLIPFQSPVKWSLPQYDVYLEVSSHQVRYAIWGVQYAAGALRKAGLWPCIGRFFWRGEFAGRLDFGSKRFPLPPDKMEYHLAGADRGGNVEVKGKPAAAATNTGISPNTTMVVGLYEGARLSILPIYRGVVLSARAVFGSVIDIMVLAAEHGPDTYCLRLQRAGIEVIGEESAAGEPLLKYKSIVRAMSMLMPWMVAVNRFGEIDVQIRRDEVLIGRVRIERRIR